MASKGSGSASTLFSELRAAKRLPSPPGTALRVLALCRRDDADVQEIADAIMSDPALSGRLLKFANSVMAGLSRKVTSVREALLLLGFRTVKMTALGFSLASSGQEPHCPGFSMKQFWAESFLRAVIARRLAGDCFGTDREEAFTAALLAGLGQLALAHGLREKYTPVLAEAQRGRPLVEVEREMLGGDHVGVGALLLQDWSLPEELVQAVQNQAMAFEPGRVGTPGQRLSQAVHFAARMAPLLLGSLREGADDADAAGAVGANLPGLDEARWKRLREVILSDYREVAELFDVELDGQASALEVCAEAQEEATRVGMVAQIEQAKALRDNENLLRQATTDSLTGVANRAKFDERIRAEIPGLRRGHGHFALLMVDIDHFKRFNDTHGHQVGDLVLKRVATAMQNVLRDVDMVARYGGEEFAVLAPHTDQKGACIIAIRIQRCIEELRIDIHGTRLGVTISIGLAITSDYAEAPTAEQLIAGADKQLYLSKEAGRNTWSYQGRSACKLAQRATAPSR